MRALVVLIVGLGIPGLLPAVAVARRSPAVAFLAPMVGAAMAAVAAELELSFPGSLLTHYIQVAVTVNLLVIGWWVATWLLKPARLAAMRESAPWSRPPWVWAILTALVVVALLRLPLAGLRAQLIGWDANSIWMTHALLVSGGHHQLLAGLQNQTYQFTNPDYPPLVPAVGALAFDFFGRGSLYIAVNMTELLAACGLGLIATGIGAAAEGGRWLARVPALAAAGAICVAGFGVAGVTGLSGYADLPWAAAAVAAIVWGLVVPKSTQALLLAWVCVIAASLTKNEGLTAALGIALLIGLRYRPPRWPRIRPYRKGRFVCMHCVRRVSVLMARTWAERLALIAAPALPGLIWEHQIRDLGLHDAFFGAPSAESLGTRAGATAAAMAPYLDVAPVAIGLLVVGSLLLRKDRRRLQIAHPAWLWLACVLGLGSIVLTYLIGSYEIHVWLKTSVSRTTVFAQLALYTDVAIWMVIAFESAFRWDFAPLRRHRRRTLPEPAEDLDAALRSPVSLPVGEHDLNAGHLERASTAAERAGSGFTAIGLPLELLPDPDEDDALAPELAGYWPSES